MGEPLDIKGKPLFAGARVEDVGTRGVFGLVERVLDEYKVFIRWDDPVDGVSTWPPTWVERVDASIRHNSSGMMNEPERD